MERLIRRRGRSREKLVAFLVSICFIAFATSTSFLMLASGGVHVGASSSLTLSLVVPATFVDYRCFSQHLIQRISENYVLPDEIIFIVSGVPSGYPTKAKENKSGLDVINIFHENHRNQALNKNLGAELATGDIILFFDVDDVLYPWAVSSAKEAFLEKGNENVAAIMLSHQHFTERYIEAKGWNSGHGSTPVCTLLDKSSRQNILALMRRADPHRSFAPFCKTSSSPCEGNVLYKSSKLYKALFQEHVFALTLTDNVHWCCLSDERPSFAAGWLLVERKKFLDTKFNTHFSVAEDGEAISRLLLKHEVEYVDVPIGYYNRDHMEPECSNVWF